MRITHTSQLSFKTHKGTTKAAGNNTIRAQVSHRDRRDPDRAVLVGAAPRDAAVEVDLVRAR